MKQAYEEVGERLVGVLGGLGPNEFEQNGDRDRGASGQPECSAYVFYDIDELLLVESEEDVAQDDVDALAEGRDSLVAEDHQVEQLFEGGQFRYARGLKLLALEQNLGEARLPSPRGRSGCAAQGTARARSRSRSARRP